MAWFRRALERRPGDVEALRWLAAASYELEPYQGDRPPPSGTLVFYACVGPIDGRVRDWGHVGLARGDGSVIHAWDVVRIDDAAAVQQLTPAAGWKAPRLIGWAPAVGGKSCHLTPR